MVLYILKTKMDNIRKTYQRNSIVYTKLHHYFHLPIFSFFHQIIMKIFSTTDFLVFQILNIVANIFIILGIFKVTNILLGKDKSDNFISFFLTITFFPLIIICNFVYGDYLGLAFAIWSLTYLFKYNENNKISSFIVNKQ